MTPTRPERRHRVEADKGITHAALRCSNRGHSESSDTFGGHGKSNPTEAISSSLATRSLSTGSG